MSKSEVYSWRVSTHTKSTLEELARREDTSVARLLERIVEEWLNEHMGAEGDSDDSQTLLHRAAAATFGTVAGGDRQRSERVRDTVRARLRKDATD